MSECSTPRSRGSRCAPPWAASGAAAVRAPRGGPDLGDPVAQDFPPAVAAVALARARPVRILRAAAAHRADHRHQRARRRDRRRQRPTPTGHAVSRSAVRSSTKFSIATVLTIIFAAVPDASPRRPRWRQCPAHVVGVKGAPGEIATAIPGAAEPRQQVRHRPVRRGAGRRGDLSRDLRHGLGGHRRAIAVGLLYSCSILEVVLANFVSGARLLSVSHYALGIAMGSATIAR